MDNQKKNDITYKRNENNYSKESEEETVDLNFLQEQKNKEIEREIFTTKKKV